MRLSPSKSSFRIFANVLVVSLCLGPTGWAAEETSNSFTTGEFRTSVREFYSSNRENRFLIKIHVWGDSPQTGIYYIPDNSTMMDIVGLTGGPMGIFERTVITVTPTQAAPSKKERPSIVKIEGREILDNAEFRTLPLHNGDVVHFDSPAKTDNLLRTLGIVSSILGVITAGASIYLITKK